MKEEKKPGSTNSYRIGFCVLLAVVFLTVSLPTAAHNHDGDDNALFSQGCGSGVDMSNPVQIEPIKDKPRVSGGKLFGEIFLGMLGNVAAGYGGALIGSQLAKEDEDEWFEGLGGLALGYFTGSTFGSAVGVYAVGNSGDAKGSFGSALLGSLLGEGAAIAVSLITKDGTTALISFIVLPPIGAALLFNSSLKHKSLLVSHALLNFDQGDFKIGIPYVHIQPLPGYAKYVKARVGFNVNLLNIVF